MTCLQRVSTTFKKRKKDKSFWKMLREDSEFAWEAGNAPPLFCLPCPSLFSACIHHPTPKLPLSIHSSLVDLFLAHDFVLRSLPAQSVRGCARNLLPSGPKRFNALLEFWLCAYLWFFSCYFGKPCQKYICGGYNAIIDNALISISASPSVTPCHGHTQYRMPYYAYIPNIWSPYLVTEFYIMQIFLISGYHWKSADL